MVQAHSCNQESYGASTQLQPEKVMVWAHSHNQKSYGVSTQPQPEKVMVWAHSHNQKKLQCEHTATIKEKKQATTWKIIKAHQLVRELFLEQETVSYEKQSKIRQKQSTKHAP